MSTGRWFTRNIEYNLADSPDQVYDRLMGEWNNLGVVSTLMLGIAFGSYGSEVDNPETLIYYDIDASKMIALLNFGSIILNFAGIMAIILLTMGLNTLPVELTGKFVSQFSLILSVPEICCMSGLLLYMFTSALTGTVLYGEVWWFGWIMLGLAFGFSAIFLCFLPMILDREGGLWEEARKINDQAAKRTDMEKKGAISNIIESAKEVACDMCF